MSVINSLYINALLADAAYTGRLAIGDSAGVLEVHSKRGQHHFNFSSS